MLLSVYTPLVYGNKHVLVLKLGKSCSWESLAARREKHKLILYYKMQNGLTPEYLSSLVPLSVGSTVRYALRNNSDLQTIPAKSQQYYKSFLPFATRLWNGLSEDKRNSPSMTTFKSKLNSNIKKTTCILLHWLKTWTNTPHSTTTKL